MSMRGAGAPVRRPRPPSQALHHSMVMAAAPKLELVMDSGVPIRVSNVFEGSESGYLVETVTAVLAWGCQSHGCRRKARDGHHQCNHESTYSRRHAYLPLSVTNCIVRMRTHNVRPLIARFLSSRYPCWDRVRVDSEQLDLSCRGLLGVHPSLWLWLLPCLEWMRLSWRAQLRRGFQRYVATEIVAGLCRYWSVRRQGGARPPLVEL